MLIKGGNTPGGAGNPDLVSGGAPTNGAQDKPTGTTASSAITFQAPTGGSGASSPSVALSHVSGSGASLSGSGLGGYTVSGLADGDVVTVTCDHTDSGDGQIITDVAVVSVAASGGVAGATWTTVHEVDFTTDITDLSVVKGAGDVTLYEADGSTVKATVGFANRTAGGGGSLAITAAAGGMLLTTTGGSGKAQFGYIKLTEAATGIDWDDGHRYAVDFLLDTLALGANTTFVLTGLGNNVGGINSGFNMVSRLQRVSATSYRQSARRRSNGASSVGAEQQTGTSAPTSIACRMIVHSGGDLLDLYWDEGTAYLSGVPVPTIGAALWRSKSGSSTIAIEDGYRFAGAATYLLMDHQIYGGTTTSRLKKLRIQRLD